jgi:hypothetical protein
MKHRESLIESNGKETFTNAISWLISEAPASVPLSGRQLDITAATLHKILHRTATQALLHPPT